MTKHLYLFILLLLSASQTEAQPVLTGGYSGMLALNGTTLTGVGTVPRNGSFIAASRDGAKFFAVATSGAPRIYIVDAGTFNVLDSIAMPAAVGDISATAETDRLFAIGDRALYRVNTATKTVVDSVVLNPVAYSFSRIKERPNAKEIWVARDSMMYVVNYSSGLAATSFKLASMTVNGPLTFTTGGSVAYKWGQGIVQKLLRIDAATHAVTLVNGNGGFPAVNADSSAVWAPGSTRMYLYSPVTLAAIDSFPIQPAPNSLYKHPTRNEMWGIGHLSDTLTVFNAATKAVLAHIRLTSDPFFLAFGAGSVPPPSGIGSPQQAEALVLFPNPAADVLTVQLPEAVTVQFTVRDATGAVVARSESSTSWTRLPVAGLPPGTYFLSAARTDGRILATRRWVKK